MGAGGGMSGAPDPSMLAALPASATTPSGGGMAMMGGGQQMDPEMLRRMGFIR
jgi:hypothetical protein